MAKAPEAEAGKKRFAVDGLILERAPTRTRNSEAPPAVRPRGNGIRSERCDSFSKVVRRYNCSRGHACRIRSGCGTNQWIWRWFWRRSLQKACPNSSSFCKPLNFQKKILVDLVGIEPTTSSMPWKRAPSCATGPLRWGRNCVAPASLLGLHCLRLIHSHLAQAVKSTSRQVRLFAALREALRVAQNRLPQRSSGIGHVDTGAEADGA
jgi:hypothetical protein